MGMVAFLSKGTIGLDWMVDMADGRKRLSSGISVQGNVVPAYLFYPLPTLTPERQKVKVWLFRQSPKIDGWTSSDTIYTGCEVCMAKRTFPPSRPPGHGVVQRTPEEAVKTFF
ncbi:hypothetical protein M0R45_014645 [Rubus argutus]|uniref:Uncharacterized protein n=1 Tax=Rubus argutus TaxID=59490 RepID=A0AAW1XN90_RUBAR